MILTGLLSGDINHELVIKYTHYIPAHRINQDGDIEGEFLEGMQISIPFPIFYPVYWMRDLFEANQTAISGICGAVIDLKITFRTIKIEKDDILLTREIYEQFLKEDFTEADECSRCYSATVSYCDKIYNDTLNIIKKSIIEGMLCLKRLDIQKDVIKSIGKGLWDTRHEMFWAKLNPINDFICYRLDF